jgi:hypothetical protein
MDRDRMYEDEAWGKPRDSKRLPAPLGNGYWSQEIYYHILDCGLRIPPSAGSASGVLPNPVGYNRVYVYLGREMSWEKWWDGLRAGRSFVTNGPLLIPEASGELPGHVFKARSGEEFRIELKARLTSRDPVRFIEVIQDGRVERRVPFEEFTKTGSLGDLRFKESGWFLMRVIAESPKTFRFASTAPYYVEVGEGKRRISKRSVDFFLSWVEERSRRVKLDDPAQLEEVLAYHRMAERFWRDLKSRANAE